MTHRYGRHGTKAWLRWRNRRFGQKALQRPGQTAVLHVPLELLSRIRKVTIFMNDGTEHSVEVTTEQLPSPIVEGNLKKESGMLAERDMSQNERFLHNAQMLAIYKAKEDYRQHSNPYILKPRVNSVIDRAQMMYSVVVGPQFTLAQSSDEAQSIFVSEFRKTYYEEIERLSVQDGAESEQLKELLIAARTDKKNDSGGLNEDAGNRAAIRAYISLLPDVPTRQEAVETVLPTLRARVELYQKFYDEFQPKEED